MITNQIARVMEAERELEEARRLAAGNSAIMPCGTAANLAWAELYAALESPDDLIKVVRAFQGQAAYLQAAKPEDARADKPAPVKPPPLQPKMIQEGETRKHKISTWQEPVKPTPPPLKMIKEGDIR